jgi:hypothetical protein
MSKFPTELDTDAELPSVIDGSTEIGAEAINAQKNAIIAVERTLGTGVQGTTGSLADRLAVSINPDGTLDAAAISASWLIGSPITNAHVSASAAIEESKLDLDVGTSVLQNQITSSAIDIDALQYSVATQIAKLASHITGTDDQHFAEDIVVSPAVAGGLNIQSALAAVQQGLTNHINDTSGAHDADSISYAPGPESSLTATSVGGALDEIDTNFINRVSRHLDTAHTNGISGDELIYLGGQGAVNAASLACVPLLPLGGQARIKIGGINHATIITKGANPAGLGASASGLVVDYSDGIAVYSVAVSGLSSSPYPTSSENRIKGVVRSLNNAFAAAGALVTAFDYQNEIVLQHNTPEGHIAVRNPIANSAVAALGLAAVVGQNSEPINHLISVTDGVPTENWSALVSGNASLGSPSFSVTLSAPVAAGSLLHIARHTAGGSGTYQVLSISGNIATLNRSVPAGSFAYAVYPDSLPIGTASSGTVYDVFVDSSAVPSAVVRAETLPAQISGVRMVSCSLQPGTYSVSLAGSGSNISLAISSGAINGEAVRISSGYLGPVVCRAPNNLGEATFEVVSLTPSSPATDTVTVSGYSGDDSLQKIASFWSSGSIVEFPVDARNLGLVGRSAIGTDVVRDIIGKVSANRRNGIVQGDRVSLSGLVANIPGHTISIGGVVRDIAPVQINLTAFAAAVQAANIYIDLSGAYRVALDSTAGYSLADILSRGEIPLLRVNLGIGIVIGSVDIRLFTAPEDPSVKLIVGDSSVDRHCSNITGALLLAAAGGFRDIAVLNNQTTVSRLVLPAGLRVLARSVTCAGLDMGIGASLDADSLVSSSSIVLANSSALTARTLGATSVAVGDYASLRFLSATFTDSGAALSLSGIGCSASGLAPGASASFTSTGTISIAIASDVILSNFSCVFSSVAAPWISLAGSCNDIKILNMAATKSTSISALDIPLHAVVNSAGTLDGLEIRSCSFSECGVTLRCAVTGTASNISIIDVTHQNFGGVLDSVSPLLSGCTMSDLKGKGLLGSIISASGTAQVVLSNSSFSGTLGSAEVVARIFSSTGSATAVNAVVSNCSFSDIKFSDNAIYAAALTGAGAVRLSIADCILSSFISTANQTVRSASTGNLIHWESAGHLDFSGNTVASSICKIFYGYNATISDNSFALLSTTLPFNINRATASTAPLASMRGNTAVFSPQSTINLDCATVVGNDISGGAFFFGSSISGPIGFAGYRVMDNIFTSIDATGAFDTAFSIYPGYLITGNRFSGSPNDSLVELGNSPLAQGQLRFCDNDCQFSTNSAAQSIVEIVDIITSDVRYVLDGSSIQIPPNNTGTAVNAINLAANSISLTRNSIFGNGINGIIFRGNGASQTGCSVVGNFVYDATVPGTDLILGPNGFADNRGTENIYSFGPHNSQLVTSAKWVESSGLPTSTSATAVSPAIAWLPLDLPYGELIEVAIELAVTAGDVVYELFSLSSTGAGMALLASGTITGPTPPPASTVTLAPASPLFVGPALTVAIKISCKENGSAIRNFRALVKL